MRLHVQSVGKSYAGTDLFQGVHMELAPGHRVAVIGSNGTGKSTLLKIIAGAVKPDQGRVSVDPPGVGMGYAWQELDTAEVDTPLFTWVGEVIPSWNEFWERWSRADKERTIQQLAREQTELELTYGYNPEHRIQSVLTGLGFSRETWHAPLSRFSGGWQERAKLARLLIQGTDILLLDEPTNHLDLEAVFWLESFLVQFKGIVVFVAHDRVFLDRVANRVLALGQGKPVFRPGTFSDYEAWRRGQEERRQREVAKLDQDIRHKQHYVDRFRYKSDKARQAQSRIKQIQTLEAEKEALAPGQQRKKLNFSWPTPPRSNHTVISVAELEFTYPEQEQLWPRLSLNLYRGQKLALVGHNGCGKSTLLQLMAGVLKPRAGQIKVGSNVRLGYFSQHIRDTLHLDRTVLSEVRRLSHPGTKEEELRSVLGLFLLDEAMWERPVHELSGGEKNRLLLSSLFLARANCLLLDEPTNHLDLESREALIQALIRYEGTLCVVAHDRSLISNVADTLYMLSEQGLQELEQGYAEYEARLGQAQANREAPAQGQGQDRDKAKERKRQEAERRNARYRLLKPKKAEYWQLEQELEQVLHEQNQVEQELADPQTYAQGEAVGDLNKRYQELQTRAESLFQDLERLERDIEGLEAEI